MLYLIFRIVYSELWSDARVSDIQAVVERLPSERPQKRNNDGPEELAAVRVDPPDPGAGITYIIIKRTHLYLHKHALYAHVVYTIRARLVIRKSHTMYR